MKSKSIKFILAQFGIIFLISVILGGSPALFIDHFIQVSVFLIFIIFYSLSLFWFVLFSGMATEKIIEKTMDRESGELGFRNYSTFHSDNSIIRVEEDTGRIAYVSKWNPFHIQTASAAELSDIKTDYIRAPLGGTTYAGIGKSV